MSEHGTKPIVFVIDDDASIRIAIEDLLASIGLEAVTFASASEFLEYNREKTRPSCLILDVRMPGQSGTDFYRYTRENGINIPVIFITGHGDISMGVKAIKDGALEFLTKPFKDHELIEVVQRGIELETTKLATEEAQAQLINKAKTLSQGESDVFKLVVAGLLNKQVAGELNISEITVKVRRAKLMHKMEANSLVDLVRMYDALHQEK
ncbi:response regulator transcription factor [Paenochrobactrum sp. BZR 588]|uniref:response regulator transcription factor n=1 Tax=unclassified Paenochrobactrum TaxID=2639760 RepID=UPI003855550F